MGSGNTTLQYNNHDPNFSMHSCSSKSLNSSTHSSMHSTSTSSKSSKQMPTKYSMMCNKYPKYTLPLKITYSTTTENNNEHINVLFVGSSNKRASVKSIHLSSLIDVFLVLSRNDDMKFRYAASCCLLDHVENYTSSYSEEEIELLFYILKTRLYSHTNKKNVGIIYNSLHTINVLISRRNMTLEYFNQLFKIFMDYETIALTLNDQWMGYLVSYGLKRLTSECSTITNFETITNNSNINNNGSMGNISTTSAADNENEHNFDTLTKIMLTRNEETQRYLYETDDDSEIVF